MRASGTKVEGKRYMVMTKKVAARAAQRA